MLIHTVGHSVHPIETFIGLCSAHGVEHVVDVRRFPSSRRYPHFDREPLAAALGEAGIGYTWKAELGGRRTARKDTPHTAWRVSTFAAYADHMETEEFEAAMAEVMALAEAHAVALMCAEARVDQCHRRLISDWLLARGIEVRHITSRTRAVVHTLTPFARLEGQRVVYDGGQLPLRPPLSRRRDE